MILPYHLRKPRRSIQEVRFLTKKAHELITNGMKIDDALNEVKLTTAVYYRNCKKMKLKTLRTYSQNKIKVNEVSDKQVIEKEVNEKKDDMNYKELLKEFLLQKFIDESRNK